MWNRSVLSDTCPWVFIVLASIHNPCIFMVSNRYVIVSILTSITMPYSTLNKSGRKLHHNVSIAYHEYATSINTRKDYTSKSQVFDMALFNCKLKVWYPHIYTIPPIGRPAIIICTLTERH